MFEVEAHGLPARSPWGLFKARADRKSLGLILLFCGVLFLRLVVEFIKQFEIMSYVECVPVEVWICLDEVGLSDIGSGFDLLGFLACAPGDLVAVVAEARARAQSQPIERVSSPERARL